MGAFGMKIKDKNWTSSVGPQRFSAELWQDGKTYRAFLAVKVSAIPSQPLELDIPPRNIWAREWSRAREQLILSARGEEGGCDSKEPEQSKPS